jgi:serine/threonine-protein kinase HipA
MYRKAKVLFKDQICGLLEETDEGYRFSYDSIYLKEGSGMAISLSLPLRAQPYESNILFPFFDGLIPEGWLLDIAIKNWKLDPKDRMGLLLTSCRDCTGAVSILPHE